MGSNKTRIVHIRPGQKTDPFWIGVFPIDLESPDPDTLNYVALSYTWEDTIRSVPIQVWNSWWTAHTIHVTRSLLDALTFPRVPDNWRRVWVDQLSINQADEKEKASQIALMGEIYRKASVVRVWLGLAADDSDLAMSRLTNLFKVVYRHVVKAENRARPFDEVVTPQVFEECVGAPTKTNIASWRAISKLLNRPWFSRIWVLQEATALPSRNVLILYGNSSTSFSVCSALVRVFHVGSRGSWEAQIQSLGTTKN